MTPIRLPDLGDPTARMSLWFLAVGDHVYEGDRVAEVRIVGATFDVPSPVSGRLVQRVAQPADCLQPGAVLGWIDPDRDEDV